MNFFFFCSEIQDCRIFLVRQWLKSIVQNVLMFTTQNLPATTTPMAHTLALVFPICSLWFILNIAQSVQPINLSHGKYKFQLGIHSGLVIT